MSHQTSTNWLCWRRLDQSASCRRVDLLSVLYFLAALVSKGSTDLLANYRPISITCVTCKLLERIVTGKIYDHLVNNDIISNSQHGFVRGRSTCTNLLESLNDWTIVIPKMAVKWLLLVHGQVTIIFVVSVCLFVCLYVCAEFFPAVFDPISIKLGRMLYVWV